MIAVIDYGMGNVRSVLKAFVKLDCPVVFTSSPQEIEKASHVVLPGVGAFGDAMRELKQRHLVSIIKNSIKDGKPFLGICIGLQVLFDSSEENPGVPGLSVIPGIVKRFEVSEELKVPHMGWNRLKFSRPPPLAADLNESPFVYFVHSYYVEPREADITCATCEYENDFTAMIWRDNLFATQFHPEKSQDVGQAMLKQFAAISS